MAAVSAAVLGSRNARRQMQAALAHAAEFGAYSVGFQLGRGCLNGFTIYLAGNYAGCGARRTPQGTAATCAVQPPTARDRAAGHAQPKARAAAARGQHRAAPCDEQAPQPGDAAQPHCAAQDAPAKRMRGCRAGRRRRARRATGSRLSAAATAATRSHADDGSSSMAHVPADSVHVCKVGSEREACVGPPAPCAPPKAPPPSFLSPSAPSFTPSHLQPPSLPLPHPSPSFSGAPSLSGAPSSALGSSPDSLTRHLLPHALFSYEELRWQHMSSRSPQKRRATSSPSPPSSTAPPPFIVGCVVNERPPPPAPTRGRERGPRSWDYRSRFVGSLSRSRSSGRQEGGE